MAEKFLFSYRRKGNKCWNDIAMLDSFAGAMRYVLILGDLPNDWLCAYRILAIDLALEREDRE